MRFKPRLVIIFVALSTGALVAQTGAITGQVFDQTKTPLDGASIVLKDGSGKDVCRTTTSQEGRFSCSDTNFGVYQAVIRATGFAEELREQVSVTESSPSVNLEVTLKLAGDSTVVTVSASTHEIATEQIHAAEKQRILGIAPNFYTSFDKNTVALSSGQKYSLAIRDLVDPVTFLSAGVSAGIEQANNSYKGYGQGAAGFGKRYGAAYADGLTSDLFRHAVYASLFHQDPRYYYQGTGSLRSRFIHAISYAVALRGDDGTTRPNYSYVAGYLTSGAISNAYYPQSDRGISLVLTRALIGVAGTAGQGLLREFVWSHVTTGRPHAP